jgi:hypothetical protein
MNRKGFLTALIALFISPFIKAKERNSLNLTVKISPKEMEKIRTEIRKAERRIKHIKRIKGYDLRLIRKEKYRRCRIK